PEGSPAHKSLIEGIDSLLLQGAVVRVTQTPDAADPNSILQREGLPALMQLIAGAQLSELSIIGEARRLAGLDRVDYDLSAPQCQKNQKFPHAPLDALVEKQGLRAGGPAPKTSSQNEEFTAPADDEWQGDVDLCTVMDTALQVVK